MVSSQSGSIPLFRFSGIRVYLHWSWFVMAWIMYQLRAGGYRSPIWPAVEYLALFLIVLLHEFGHSLACRQTGGTSDEIVLWPLGGVAYVRPPPRAGAELWSIAAGPLVNVALIPVILGLMWARRATGITAEIPDARRFLQNIEQINYMLLIFNMLPLYPLDGGQILRSLLWFKLGRARSLQVATMIGFVAIPLAGAVAYFRGYSSGIWILIMGGFVLQQCIEGYKRAQAMLALEAKPRHQGFACPACRQAPPGGPMWRCASCGNGFDPFSTQAICPHCRAPQASTPCPHCGATHPLQEWHSLR